MRYSLQVLDGGELKQRYDLDREEILIGRGPACHVVLEGRSVSRVHARLVREGDGYTIEDLRSLFVFLYTVNCKIIVWKPVRPALKSAHPFISQVFRLI